MKLFLSFIASLFVASQAQASLCALEADLSGSSTQFIVGGTKLSGYGEIKCLNQTSGKFEWVTDVVVNMEGAGFGLGHTKISNAKLHSTGLGIVESADALTGTFLFAKAGFQLGPVGADAGATLYFSGKKGKRGLAVPFGMTFKKGEGLQLTVLEFMEVTVTPIDAD